MEVAGSRNEISVSQWKYVLDFHKEIGMLGCKLAETSMDSSTKFGANKNNILVDKAWYQILIGKLIYLSRTKPDLTLGSQLV